MRYSPEFQPLRIPRNAAEDAAANIRRATAQAARYGRRSRANRQPTIAANTSAITAAARGKIHMARAILRARSRAGRPGTGRGTPVPGAAEDVLAAEGPAEDLPGGMTGDLADDLDHPGDLEPGQEPADAVRQALRGRGGALVQHDHGLHGLPGARVGDPDHGGLGHPGQAGQG